MSSGGVENGPWHSIHGTVSVKVEPSPSLLLAVMHPPISSASWALIERPSPVPPYCRARATGCITSMAPLQLVPQVRWFCRNRHLTRVNFGKIKNIVEKAQHRSTGICDYLKLMALLRL